MSNQDIGPSNPIVRSMQIRKFRRLVRVAEESGTVPPIPPAWVLNCCPDLAKRFSERPDRIKETTALLMPGEQVEHAAL